MSPFASVYGCVLVTTSAARQTPGGPGTRGMDSWLDDTDQNFGPDLPYCLKCTKFGQLVKANMHQIRFRLGFCARPGWGAYSAPPDSLTGFKGSTSKGREGKEREGRGHPRFLPGLTPLVQSLL